MSQSKNLLAPRVPSSPTAGWPPGAGISAAHTAGSTVLTGDRLRTQKESTTNLRSPAQSALKKQPVWHAYVAATRRDWKTQECLALPHLALAKSLVPLKREVTAL